MDAERARAFLLTLPHVVETEQWGNNLLYWVGDKSVGGKMFALLDLDGDLSKGVGTWAAGPERFAELVENEDIYPAPYFGRIHWVAARHWGALRNAEWEEEYRAAHARVMEKLAPKAKRALGLLPPKAAPVKKKR